MSKSVLEANVFVKGLLIEKRWSGLLIKSSTWPDKEDDREPTPIHRHAVGFKISGVVNLKKSVQKPGAQSELAEET